jgi:hypothetical protein
MVQRDFFNPSHVVRGIFALFALLGTVLAAEPSRPGSNLGVEAAQSAGPVDGQFLNSLSKLGFYGEIGPIFLHRQSNRSAALIAEAITGGTVLNATSLNLDWHTGLEARGGATLGNFGVEIRWFNVGRVFHGWSADANVTTPLNWKIPAATDLVGFPAARTSAGLTSSLANLEGNLSWQVHPYVALLAGARRLSLDDDLEMKFDTGINAAHMNIASRNTLWGGQIGVQGRYPLLTEDLFVGGVVKSAYLHNATKNRFTLVQQIGRTFGAGDRDGQNTWAFELGMDLRYNVHSWVTVLAGYQGLWLRRVAHATDQLNRFNLITRGGDIRARSVWFHGPRVAIVIRLPG